MIPSDAFRFEMLNAQQGRVIGYIGASGEMQPVRCHHLTRNEIDSMRELVNAISQRIQRIQSEFDHDHPELEQAETCPFGSRAALRLGMGLVTCQFLKALEEMYSGSCGDSDEQGSGSTHIDAVRYFFPNFEDYKQRLSELTLQCSASLFVDSLNIS